MATTAITVEVDNIHIADEAVSALGWDVEELAWHSSPVQATVRLVTTENISVARMLGDFWTEYADIAETDRVIP